MKIIFRILVSFLIIFACSPNNNTENSTDDKDLDILTKLVGSPIDTVWYNSNGVKDQHICVQVVCAGSDYFLIGQMFGFDTLFLSLQKSNLRMQYGCGEIGALDTCYWYDNFSPSDSVVFKYWNTDSTIKMVKLPARSN